MMEVLPDSAAVLAGAELALADSVKAVQAQMTELNNTTILTANNVWMIISALLVFLM